MQTVNSNSDYQLMKLHYHKANLNKANLISDVKTHESEIYIYIYICDLQVLQPLSILVDIFFVIEQAGL